MFEKPVKQQKAGAKSNLGQACEKLFSKFQSRMGASGFPADQVVWTKPDTQKYVLSSHNTQKPRYENSFICIQLLIRETVKIPFIQFYIIILK